MSAMLNPPSPSGNPNTPTGQTTQQNAVPVASAAVAAPAVTPGPAGGAPAINQAALNTPVRTSVHALWLSVGVVLGVLAWSSKVLWLSGAACAGLVVWAALQSRRFPWTAVVVGLAGVGLVVAPLGHGGAALGMAVLTGAFPAHLWVEQLRRDARPSSFILLVALQPAAALASHLVTDGSSQGMHHAPELLQSALVVSAILHAGMGLVAVVPARAVLAIVLSQGSLAVAGMFSSYVGRLASIMMLLGTGAGAVVLLSTCAQVEHRFGVGRLAPDNGLSLRAPQLGASMLAMGWLFCGLPGGITFFAEDLLFHALLEHSAWATFGFLLASGINAIVFFRVYVGLFGGVSRTDVKERHPDAPGVLVMQRVLTLMVLVLGLAPSLFF
jgi:NADH:ubiquinone oxidoreductase subunit 2 (subunit N)